MPGLSPEGFDQFFAQDFTRLVGFVIRLGARREDAQDAAQAAMTHLARTGAAVEHPHAWVRKVAQRVFRDMVADQRGYASTAQLLAATTPELTSDLGPAERGEADEADRVNALLGRLPWLERAAMAWEMDGFTARETAQILGTTVDQVTNARRRAGGRLIRLIADEAPDLLEAVPQRAERKG